MAKRRMIDTRFWSDNFIVELNPLDRYLFLYFLTNEHTNICGIYELPLKRIADETGIEKFMIEKMLKRLKGKVAYIDGWVALKNFAKYQSDNESVKIGIEKAKSVIPSHILTKVDRVFTGWNRVSTPPDISESESESELKPEKELEVAEPSSADIISLIDSFKEVNPAFNGWYANKTQRAAAKWLIDTYGLEEAKRKIALLPKINKIKYAPITTTPCQLRDNMARIENFLYQEKSKLQTKERQVII